MVTAGPGDAGEGVADPGVVGEAGVVGGDAGVVGDPGTAVWGGTGGTAASGGTAGGVGPADGLAGAPSDPGPAVAVGELPVGSDERVTGVPGSTPSGSVCVWSGSPAMASGSGTQGGLGPPARLTTSSAMYAAASAPMPMPTRRRSVRRRPLASTKTGSSPA
jgi:hypothetical protein